MGRIIILLIIFGMLFWIHYDLYMGVSIGDTWSYNPYRDNPFNNKVDKKYKVLDIKNNYVKYIDIENGTIHSSSILYFKVGAKKISEEKK